MSPKTYNTLSGLCFLSGFASILLAVFIWNLYKQPDPSHAERFGIFIGLWAPTFFALSSRLDRYARPMPTSS
jgi:hypothetical protein